MAETATKMSKIEPDTHIKFLVSCIGHSSSGKPNFAAVAEELGIVSKAAAQKRFERLLKAHNVTSSPKKGNDKALSGEEATPTKKRKTPPATPVSAAKKKKMMLAAAAAEQSDDDDENDDAEDDDGESGMGEGPSSNRKKLPCKRTSPTKPAKGTPRGKSKVKSETVDGSDSDAAIKGEVDDEDHSSNTEALI